jgi:hypothetical protein
MQCVYCTVVYSSIGIQVCILYGSVQQRGRSMYIERTGVYTGVYTVQVCILYGTGVYTVR